MPKLEELKERIAFLTKFLTILVSIAVLTIGGIISLYIKKDFSLIFWLGSVLAIFLTILCAIILFRIENHMKEIGRL